MSQTAHSLTSFLRIRRPPLDLGWNRYWMLWAGVVAQLATVIITWPNWQVRDSPPNLPIWDVPQISFGWLVILTLVAIPLFPKRGVIVHAVVLGLAISFDLFRLQPQYLANACMMFAAVWQPCTRLARWGCVALWFWAGLHKFISADWWGPTSASLLSRLVEEPPFQGAQLAFIIGIAISEMGLGILAFTRPRWAMFCAAPLHLGIILFLLGIEWNYSVIPWNLGMALVGTWVFFDVTTKDSAPIKWEPLYAALILLIPLGFYNGTMNHGIAHVLYSDSLPRGRISTIDQSYEIKGWGKLAVPFPKERYTHRIYFKQVAKPGDKLHISDSRRWLDDLYYELNSAGRLVEIGEKSFYRESSTGVIGVGVDRDQARYGLLQIDCRLQVRSDFNDPIWVVRFNPDRFDPDALKYLRWLPNVEEIDFSHTSIQDEDLKHLKTLYRLEGIVLRDTDLTDDGLTHLRDLPNLRIIEAEDTAITQEAIDAIVYD